MALSGLGSITSGTASTLDTSSVTPTGGATVYVFAGQLGISGGSGATLDTPTWLSGSWTQIATSNDGGNSECIVWRGTAIGSPSADTVTVDWGAATTGASVRIYEDDDVADPAVASADNRLSSTAPTVDVGTPTSGNRQVVFSWSILNGTLTEDASFTTIDNDNTLFGNNVIHHVAEADPAPADGDWTASLSASATSNIIAVEVEPSAGDTTAPTLTSPTGTSTGETTASGTVSTDEDNGTLDAVVTTSATTPSAAQIQAGQDHTGSAAAATDLNNTVSATGSQSVSFTGLTASTTYYVHYVHEDTAANVSTAVSSSSFTTDAVDTTPSIDQTSLNELRTNIAFSQTLTATDGEGTLVWSVSAGTLPTGITRSGATLSGTPTVEGAYDFTIQVTDENGAGESDTQQFTGSVVQSNPNITTTTLPDAEENTAYSQTLAVTLDGGTAEANPWSITVGSLPAGLSLNTATGEISGTPDPVTLDDERWTVSAGTLPAGLSLNETTGAITGTPSGSGAYDFTVQCRDEGGTGLSDTQQFTGTIAAADLTPSIDQTSLNALTQNTAFSQTLTATSGDAPLTWTVSAGTIPAGLSLATNGAITGTPTGSGAYDFTVQVSDDDSDTDTQQFTGTVAADLTPSIDQTSLDAMEEGVAFSQTLTATSGDAPLTWTVSAGTIVSGLSLATNGALTGTPDTPGAYDFTVQVEDDDGDTDTQQFTGTVAVSSDTTPAIDQTSIGSVLVGVAFSQTFTATNGNLPLTWSVSAGTLPAGLSLTDDTLSGTPTTAGAYDFTIQVSDDDSDTDTQQFTGSVATVAPPTGGSYTVPGRTGMIL